MPHLIFSPTTVSNSVRFSEVIAIEMLEACVVNILYSGGWPLKSLLFTACPAVLRGTPATAEGRKIKTHLFLLRE